MVAGISDQPLESVVELYTYHVVCAQQYLLTTKPYSISTGALHRYGALRGISVLDLRIWLVGSAISSVRERSTTEEEGIRM
jgi:hypothetical protein